MLLHNNINLYNIGCAKELFIIYILLEYRYTYIYIYIDNYLLLIVMYHAIIMMYLGVHTICRIEHRLCRYHNLQNIPVNVNHEYIIVIPK